MRFLRHIVGAVAALVFVPPSHAVDSGTLRGQLTVLRKRFFGGVAEVSDRGGAVVYLTGFQRPAPATAATLEQRNEQFQPRVLPIVAGQNVTFPNRDPIYHNVFSVSPLHAFDLGQHTANEPPPSEVFAVPGLVPVYCNIHPDMIAYIVVLENDAFAMTGADGSFAIENVPAGSHRLHAWMPAAQPVSQNVEITAGQTLNVSLRLQQTEKIEPHKRKDGQDYPPRVPDNY